MINAIYEFELKDFECALNFRQILSMKTHFINHLVKVNYFQSSKPNQDISHFFEMLILDVNISKPSEREIQVAMICQKKWGIS